MKILLTFALLHSKISVIIHPLSGAQPAGGACCRRANAGASSAALHSFLEICRLRSIQNKPLVIETTYHPYQRFPGLLHTDLADRSIYETLEGEYDAYPVEALDRFIADAATKAGAHLLGVPPGALVLRARRTARDKSGQLMEFTLSIDRADQYQFVIDYKEVNQDR